MVEDGGFLVCQVVCNASYAFDVCPRACEDGIAVEGDRVLMIID